MPLVQKHLPHDAQKPLNAPKSNQTKPDVPGAEKTRAEGRKVYEG